MRRWFIVLPFVVGACSSTDFKGPTLPGYVNAPPPTIAAAGDAVLTGTVWSWQGTLMSDDKRIVPEAADRYTLLFDPGGMVSVRADCNRGSGTYTLNGNALSFGPIALTRMMCAPGYARRRIPQGPAGRFPRHLFSGNDLVLTLKYDSGSMRFATPRQ